MQELRIGCELFKPLGAYLPPGQGRSANLNGFGEDAWGRVYAFSNFGGIYRLALR